MDDREMANDAMVEGIPEKIERILVDAPYLSSDGKGMNPILKSLGISRVEESSFMS